MSTPDLQSIITKVGHLRRLASAAGTQAEAEAALAQAAAIMQKYRLDEAAVEMGGAAPAEEPTVTHDPLHNFGARSVTWRLSLGAAVGAHFGCYVYEHAHRFASGERKVTLQIVGRAGDVAMARYVFAWADAEITRLAQRESGKAAKNAFARGCVMGFRDALKRGAEGVGAELAMPSSPMGQVAMVLAGRLDDSKAAAERHVAGRFATKAPSRVSDGSALRRGYAAGSEMRPATGLGSGGAPRALAQRNG